MPSLAKADVFTITRDGDSRCSLSFAIGNPPLISFILQCADDSFLLGRTQTTELGHCGPGSLVSALKPA